MKVIGMVRSDSYICEVSHTEIERFLNLYYNKLNDLKVGSEIDLGKGYAFHHDTKAAMKAIEELIKSNKKVIEAILNGVCLITNMEES